MGNGDPCNVRTGPSEHVINHGVWVYRIHLSLGYASLLAVPPIPGGVDRVAGIGQSADGGYD
jgi:hypothetical protein